MEHPCFQPTLSVAEGTHQPQELSLSHPEQPSRPAQHAAHLHNHTTDSGFAQLNPVGEHSGAQITSNLQNCGPRVPAAGLPDSGKRKRTRDWTEAETSALLKRVNLPQFRYQQRNQYCMKWGAIAREIQNAVGSDPAVITGKRCKGRMKTLTGCYENVKTKTKKGFAVDWWHRAIGEFCGPPGGKWKERNPATKRYAKRFSSLNKLQMSTLLDLHFIAKYLEVVEIDWSLSTICEPLSFVQNRSCLAIYGDVIALEKMGLFRRESDVVEGEGPDNDEEVTSESRLDYRGLLMHEKFFKKAVDRNPAYDTRRIIEDDAMVTFDATSAPSGITMLFLHHCKNLEVVDLSGFRELRFLSIWWCPKLHEMVGCECLEVLRWLEIWGWPSYQGYPPVQNMPSLQEFRFCCPFDPSERVLPGGELDVSGCIRLRTLQIAADWTLSSIRGLEKLCSLTALRFWNCKTLRNLPDIGHMKDLTHLSLFSTPVEEIKGVEKLSSLKELDCWRSKLKALPDLGHLPHLRSVNLFECPVIDDPSSPYHQQPRREFKSESEYVDVSDSE